MRVEEGGVMQDRVNADFSVRAVLDTDRLPWTPSPQKGVERRLLDRVGGEVARATSLVRYAPDSVFPAHNHARGEEFFVLDGVFSDEHGDYPVGTYVRNPPGSSHSPRTDAGCIIFVKLRQMPPEESERIIIDTNTLAQSAGETEGHQHALLFEDGRGCEQVAIEHLSPGAKTEAATLEFGEELYVLSGVLDDESGRYPANTWVRNPAGYRRALHSRSGARFWSKRGHLGSNLIGGS